MSGLPVRSGDASSPDQGGGQTRGPDQRLGRSRRLTRSPQIREAFDQRRKQVGRTMVFWLRTGDDASLRLAVVASRKVGGAVQRARARRKLREVFRRNRRLLSGSFDVVLVARAAVVRAGADEIEKEFLELSRRAGVYKPA